MKSIFILCFLTFTLVLVFSGCGTVEPTSNSNIKVLEGLQVLDTVSVKYIEFADIENGSISKALEKTANWAKNLPNVSLVNSLDGLNMRIVLKSGQLLDFNLVPVDNEVYSIFRGGGTGLLNDDKTDELLKRTIPSNKILIFAAAYSEFYKPGELEKITSHFSKSKLKFDVRILRDEQCTPDVLSNINNYGLVIIDTHGNPDGFLIGKKLEFKTKPKTEEDVINLFKSDFGSDYSYKKILNNELIVGFSIQMDSTKPNWQKTPILTKNKYKISATSKFITNLPKSSGTIIFGNCCYSGWGAKLSSGYMDPPLRTAFLSLNPISYYGYTHNDETSTTVTDNFAKKMEDSLIKSLVIDFDTTKNANLTYDNKEFNEPIYTNNKLWFRHYNHDDYCFNDCITEFIDERDGQVYKAVCIGKQNWMAENLRYNSPGSMCYDSSDANCGIFGKLYPWIIALAGSNASMTNPSGVRGICPKGWHIPSKAEWEQLFANFGTDTVARALKMKSDLWKNWVGETNSSGFSAIPGGFFTWTFDISTGNVRKFQFKGEHALFLSTSTDGQGKVYVVSLQSQSSKIVPFTITNDLDPNQPPANASCRCVKD
ncbi:MAG: hypothetical protein N2319_01845 [Candidatus Kapabacteria bacterium]|nr:hypothetical protein [Candidatus Kapabacteria bacterium]